MHSHSNPAIIFDMDDVVAKMRERMSETLTKMSGKVVPHESWHTICCHTLYGVEFCADTMVRERIIERCEPEPDAQFAFQALHDKGFHIVIATARGWHPQGHELTQEWLERHGLPHDELHVVGLGEGSSKADVFTAVSRDRPIQAFIDDQLRYLQQADDHPSVDQVVVMDRPWNRDTPLPRVTSLREFAHLMVK